MQEPRFVSSEWTRLWKSNFKSISKYSRNNYNKNDAVIFLLEKYMTENDAVWPCWLATKEIRWNYLKSLCSKLLKSKVVHIWLWVCWKSTFHTRDCLSSRAILRFTCHWLVVSCVVFLWFCYLDTSKLLLITLFLIIFQLALL